MANEYLQRTPTSTGNQKVFTISVWYKKSINNSVSSNGQLTFLRSGDTLVRFDDNPGYDDRIRYYAETPSGTTILNLIPSYIHRDNSGWQHILVNFDSTQSTDVDRASIYVNGIKLTKFEASTRPAIDALTEMFISGTPINLGFGISGEYFKGQLCDYFVIDGQALTPDVFGFYKQGKGYISAGSTQATDFRPGQWVPKTPRVIKTEINRRGGFGVNGFYLPMNDSKNFGADFHCDPNSIIKLNEELPQPRVGVATTAAVGLGYTDALRADPYAANLVLALPFVSSGLCTNGTNVGVNTGFGDYSHIIRGSGSAKVPLSVTNPSIATTASYYGNAAFFNGSTSELSYVANISDFNFTSSDFTIEAWCFPTNLSSAQDRNIFALYNTSSNRRSYRFGFTSFTTQSVLSDNGTNTSEVTGPAGICTNNQWYHVAYVKKGQILTHYLNGVAVGIKTNEYASLYSNTLDSPQISLSGAYGGYIQDFRIYKGVAKYTGGFDVPKPYTPVGIATWRAVPDTTANNFATLNPLANGNAANSGGVQVTYTNGNNTGTWSAGNNNATFATVGFSTGKWYWEGRLRTVGGSFPFIGISSQVGISTALSTSNFGQSGTGPWLGNGTLSANDIVGVAVSFTSAGVGSTITFYLNGVETVNGTSNRNLFDGQTNTWIPGVSGVNGSVWDFNFGQNPTFSGNTTAGTFTDSNGKGLFKYQPPSGFLALCEDNLPTPAISDPGKYFKTVLYTGDGNNGRSIVGVGFTPDLVWIKRRATSPQAHAIHDSVRGPSLHLESHSTNAEETNNVYGALNSFNSDGFSLSLGSSGGGDYVNFSGQTYVAWCWRAGAGTTSTNTNGSITSVVSVNQDAGFSIVSYTGNGVSNATVGHGLGKVPAFGILKCRDTNSVTNTWRVHHKAIPEDFLYLNLTDGKSATSSTSYGSLGTFTSSSIVTLQAGIVDSTMPNENTKRYIMYLWAEIEGFSKAFSYVGNGSADGPFVFTNHRPAWVLIKRTDINGENWLIYDCSRNSVNPTSSKLAANSSVIEDDATIGNNTENTLDLLSNGFKLRTTNTGTNASGGTYIGMSFAESPFSYSNSK